MNASTLWRSALTVAGVWAAPLAFAQEAVEALERPGMPPPWAFIAFLAGMGMLIPIAIVVAVNINEYRKERDRLATIERLAAAGHAVPPEVLHPGPPKLTLPEQRRADIRRAIAFLCWGIGIGAVLYIVYGGNPRAAAWSLLLIVPGLGNFLKAWAYTPIAAARASRRGCSVLLITRS